MSLPRRASLVLGVLLIGLFLTGCLGGGGRGVSLETLLSAVIDKEIQATLSENSQLLSEVYADPITIRAEDATGQVALEMTYTAASYMTEVMSGWSTSTTLRYEVTNRRLVSSGGDTAVMTGFLLTEVRDDFSGFRQRMTADVEYTFINAGGSWRIRRITVRNFSFQPLQVSAQGSEALPMPWRVILSR